MRDLVCCTIWQHIHAPGHVAFWKDSKTPQHTDTVYFTNIALFDQAQPEDTKGACFFLLVVFTFFRAFVVLVSSWCFASKLGLLGK
jgi:hypothetical protein